MGRCMEDCINSIIYGFLVKKKFGFVLGFLMILLMNLEKISNKLIIFVLIYFLVIYYVYVIWWDVYDWN